VKETIMIKKSMIRHVISMARGILVLDENLLSLSEELKKKKIRILKILPGTDDEDIKEHSLSGRIFVTNNSKDFVRDAGRLEYGIISTENIKSKDAKNLAQLISDEIIKNQLWSKEKGFILYLRDNGMTTFKNLK
jgi:hypothetical protein